MVATEVKLAAELHHVAGRPLPGGPHQRAERRLGGRGCPVGRCRLEPASSPRSGATCSAAPAGRQLRRGAAPPLHPQPDRRSAPLLTGAAAAGYLNRKATLDIGSAPRLVSGPSALDPAPAAGPRRRTNGRRRRSSPAVSMPRRAVAHAVGVPGGRRGRRATAWSAWAPTSSRARCSPPTAAGLFPMPVGRRGRLGWWSPDPRAVHPARRAARQPVAAAQPAPVRDPGRHRVRRGRAACADPARPHGWISPDGPGRVHAGCTSSAGPTRWRRGTATTASWLGASTASPSAACSPASRCSTAAPTRPRWRWWPWSTCCATAGGRAPPSACSTSSG